MKARQRRMGRLRALAAAAAVVVMGGVALADNPVTLLFGPTPAQGPVMRMPPIPPGVPGVGTPPRAGAGPWVAPRVLIGPIRPGDHATSVDRCLVQVPQLDPRFIVQPPAIDERMVVSPRVAGRPVGQAPTR